MKKSRKLSLAVGGAVVALVGGVWGYTTLNGATPLDASKMATVERGAVPEADLGVAVEVNRPADLAVIEPRIAGDDVPVMIVTGDVREVSVELVVREQRLVSRFAGARHRR